MLAGEVHDRRLLVQQEQPAKLALQLLAAELLPDKHAAVVT
jgi:hypothetical protein